MELQSTSVNTTVDGSNMTDYEKQVKDIWGTSTHQYLFTSNWSKPVPLIYKIVGYTMIVLQILIYIGVAVISSQVDKREVAVVANIGDSHNQNQLCVEDVGLTVNDFYCNGNAGSNNIVTNGVANVLILVFMTPDIVKAITNFNLGIIGSLLIIFEGFCAIACTVSLIVFLPYDSENLDVILSAVGIAFVHDMDEKFYDAIRCLKARDASIYFVIVVVIVVGGAIAAGA